MPDDKRKCTPEERDELVFRLKEGGLELRASSECVANMAVLKGGKPDFTVTRVTLGGTWEATDEPGAATQGNRGFILRWETVSAGFGELTLWESPEGLFCDSEGMGREFIQAVFKKFAESLEIP